MLNQKLKVRFIGKWILPGEGFVAGIIVNILDTIFLIKQFYPGFAFNISFFLVDHAAGVIVGIISLI